MKHHHSVFRYKGGVFHFLEKYLNRRLFWIVCQVKTQSLPACHYRRSSVIMFCRKLQTFCPQLHTNKLKLRRLITVRGKSVG